MIVSFAWTSLALVTGNKRVTRRDYSHDYLQHFRVGDLIDAYDRNPRNQGVKIADIKLISVPRRETLDLMPDQDYEREGFKFYDDLIVEGDARIEELVRKNFGLPAGRTLEEHFHRQRTMYGSMKQAVLRFELVDVTPAGVALARRFGHQPWVPSPRFTKA